MPLEDANPDGEVGENRKLDGDGNINYPVHSTKAVKEQDGEKFVDLSKLVDAVEQQTEQLRSLNAMNVQHTELFRSMIGQLKSLDERQAAADTSMKPIPQLPANSSNAWMALWQSFKDQVNPAVERLRGGLDALLVFIGLFSAIVTAFLVDSAKNLEPDEASRTNDLLANLTEIVLAISGTHFANLSLPYETTFVPESSDVRPNAYWFISLVISLLVAAISVVCRGFLTSILETTLKSATPSLVLTEVYEKWQNAERFLKPVAESVPQMMVLPVILFVLGLLDILFNLNSHLDESSSGLVIAFALSCALALLTVVALLFFLAHGVKFPGTSPFQSLLSKLLSDYSPYLQKADQACDTESTDRPSRKLSEKETATFSRIIQTTRDDSVLEQGSAILSEVLKLMDRSMYYDLMPSSNVLDVIIYMLSPEASFRSNLTAVETITDFMEDNFRIFMLSMPKGQDAIHLLQSCIDLAQRIRVTRGSRVLLDSRVFRAICALVRPDRDISRLGLPDVFRLLYWENSQLVDERFSKQLAQLSLTTTETYTPNRIESNVDLIWSNYGDLPENFWFVKWESSAQAIISHSLRIHSRTSFSNQGIQSVFRRMVRVLPLDKQVYLLIPLSKIPWSSKTLLFLALSLDTLHREFSEKAGDWKFLADFHVTGCVKALVAISRRLQKLFHPKDSSTSLDSRRDWRRSFFYLIKFATLFVGSRSSLSASSLKETIIQLLHEFGDVLQRFRDHFRPFVFGDVVRRFKDQFGPLVTCCLEIWPDMKVPSIALQDDFKAKFYPLLDGWERKVDKNVVLFHNIHTDSMTKDFPGSTANPTEITPADIMLPEDDEDSDRLSDGAAASSIDRDAESSDLSGPDNGDGEGSNVNIATASESPGVTSRFMALPERMVRVLRSIRTAGTQVVDETRGQTIELAERGQASDPTRGE